MAGVVAFAVADSSFSYLTEVNNYGSGTFLDTGWVAGYLLIGLGALWAVTSPSREVERTEASTVSLVAPYLPVLVVLAVTSIQLLRGRHIEPVSWVMAFALVVLVLGREALGLWDRAVVSRRGSARSQIERRTSRCQRRRRCPVEAVKGMSGYHPGPLQGDNSVRLVREPFAGQGPSRGGGLGVSKRPVRSVSSRTVTAWIVRSIILATTAFAILDLSLLVSSVHH